MIPADKNGLSVIMGTRNESMCIEGVVEAYSSVLLRISRNTELVLADYSDDDTLSKATAIAKKCSLNCTPVRVDKPGRGYALRLGVEHARYDLICLADGDGSHDPEYIPKMLDAYIPGSIVMASRFPPLGWSDEHSFLHYYGNRIAIATVNLLFGTHVTDVTNGFGLMSKQAWDTLSLDSDHWSFDTQIICRALKNRIRIIEVPSFEPGRVAGRAKLNVIDAAWRIGGRVLLERTTK